MSESHPVTRRTSYLVRDEFGARLAQAAGVASTELHGSAADVELPEGTTCYVVVHAGRDTTLRDGLDRTAFARGVAGVGVELLPTRIVCGPATLPGATACYACYLARAAQHRDAEQDYDIASSTRGLPEGFGPQHLSIARGLLAQALDELDSGPRGVGGTVRSFDLVTGGLGIASTVAVDRCPRCGGRFRDAAAGPSALAELP